MDAPSLGEGVGTLAVAVGLTGGEISPVSTIIAVVKREVEDDRWGHHVSDCVVQNGFFYFLK